MALFEITKTNDIAGSMSAIMNSQLDNIVDLCSNFQQNPDKAVHEIRKSFKRLRAVLRLIREEIGYSSYFRENDFFRDESKLISGLRDLHVFEEDVRALKKNYRKQVDVELCNAFVEHIRSSKEELYQKKISDECVFAKIKTDVLDCKNRINQFQFYFRDFDCIKGGLYRIYQKGRKELKNAKNNPSVENLHDLRKRVKYLMYHIQILSPIWPEYLKGLKKFLDRIAEQLGDDHNYAVLIGYLRQNPVMGYGLDRHEQFFTWLEEKRTNLYLDALIGVEKVYVEQPEVFVGRIEQLWKKFNKQ